MIGAATVVEWKGTSREIVTGREGNPRIADARGRDAGARRNDLRPVTE